MLWWLATMGTGFAPAWGNELSTHIGDYTIQNWQAEQGLPHVTVTSIAQTPDGYLWVGTFGGLARFDGVRFTVFDDGNTPALGNSAITQLQVDEQGALWIVTLAGGLVRMAAGQFTLALQEDTDLLLGAGEFSNDPRQRLLVRDRSGQWCRIEQGQLRSVPETDPLGVEDLPRFLFQNSGITWITQPGKMNLCEQTVLPVLTGEGANSNRVDLRVRSAAPSQSGGYWLFTETGIYRLRDGRISLQSAPLPPNETQILILKEDGLGNLWAGKWGTGVYGLGARGSWQLLNAGRGLTDNHVNCLFRDREGSLWVGTGQGGLHRIRPRVFQVYDTESGANVILSVTQDRQGQMWFGVNGGGLHTWTEGKLKPATEPATLRKFPLTYSVLADHQDALWIGLYGVVALRWHGDSVTRYDLSQSPGPQPERMTPHAFFEDHTGTMWAGCTHGLLRYENGRFTPYTTQGGLSSDTVVALAEDRSEALYVATDGGGLYRLRQGRFSHFEERDGPADDHLTSLCVDHEDTLWIGTVNRGLCRFRDGHFATVSDRDTLPSRSIGSVLEDDSGHLWLGSNHGIIRLSRSGLNAYLDGKKRTFAWHVFGLSDGLNAISWTSGGQPRSCKARDGKLWFATVKGVAVVDPNHLPSNPLPPPVVIEEVVMDEKSVAWAQPFPAAESLTSQEPRITNDRPNLAQSPIANRPPRMLSVPPRTRRIDFHFSGLSLAAAEKVRFRFRLEPFDRDWVEAGTRRTAYYTAVPPGQYRFQVTACNNDGVWNEQATSVALVVLPAWWKTWWFRMAGLLGAAGLVFGWYELRLHRLRRQRLAQESFSRQLIASQENERQHIAGELHDGISQELLVIANQAQLSLRKEQNSPGAAARLNEIAETAKHVLEQARQMAHNLRPGLLEELGFTEAVQASADKAAQASGMVLSVDATNVDGLLPPEFEVNLFRIVQEALNNILKHAAASQAKILLTHEPASVRLVIEDNGRGFDPGRLEVARPDERGLGMRQISERAKMMGARLDLHSRPGQGTRLAVEVPLVSKSTIKS